MTIKNSQRFVGTINERDRPGTTWLMLIATKFLSF